MKIKDLIRKDLIRLSKFYSAPSNNVEFKEQEVGEPFTVYVVFENIAGLLREYKCIITPHKILGIKISNAFRIKLYRYDENGYYFELYNKVHYNYGGKFLLSVLFLKGDGTDVRYTNGSYKYVFVDKKCAIEYAKSHNSAVFNTFEHAKGEIERFQIKEKEGDIKVEIDNEMYTICLGKESFTVHEIPNISFNYNDCKAHNGVVVKYKMVELIKKHLKENK